MSPVPGQPTRPNRLRRAAAWLAGSAIAVVGALVPAAANAAEETGSLSGTVTVPGGYDVTAVTVFTQQRDGTGNRITSPAPDGTYTVADLPPGAYVVQFISYDGLVTEYWDDTVVAGQETLVQVTAGADRAGVDATLVVGASISGTVSVPAGHTPDEIEVSANGWPGPGYASAHVAGDGTYTVKGLPAGTYAVYFRQSYGEDLLEEWWQDAKDDAAQTTITVTLGQHVTGVDAAIETGGSISGTVSVPDGYDPTDVWASATSASGYTSRSGSVAADGSYRIGGLATADYTVHFQTTGSDLVAEYWDDAALRDDADAVAVVQGQDTPGIDAALAVGGTISGTVTVPAGVDPQSVYVQAYALSADGGADAGEPVGTNPGADGTYAVRGLPAGDYVVAFSSWSDLVREYWDDAASFEEATPVTVTAAGTRSGVDATLTTGGTISGTVTVPSGAHPTDVHVVATSDDGTSYATGSVDPDGTYLVRGLLTGSYRVHFVTQGTSLVAEFYDDVLRYDLATQVPVTVGQPTEGIDAALVRGGSISGTVTAPDGFDLHGVWVYASTPDGFTASAQVGPDGTYTVDGLVDGAYLVQFSPPFTGSGLLPEYWQDARSSSTATRVTVSGANDVTGIDAALEEAASVSGTVTVPGGHDPADVAVFLSPTDAGFGYSASPADDGTYTVEGVQPGSYTVQFQAPGTDLAPQYWAGVYGRDAATVVTLTAGQRTTGVDAAMAVGGTITGHVTVPAGFDVREAYVWADGDVAGGWADVAADGGYAVRGLPPGQYTVEFGSFERGLLREYWQGTTSRPDATPVAVALGGAVTGVDAALEVGGTVTGTVTVPAGFDGYCVLADAGWYGEVLDQECNDAGEPYELMGLPTGGHVLEAFAWRGDTDSTLGRYHPDADRRSAATPVPVTAGATTSGRSFDLSATPVQGPHQPEIAVTLDPAQPVSGQPTQVTVTVSGEQGVPTGVVQLWGDLGYLGDAALSGGTATVTADLTDAEWVGVEYRGSTVYGALWDGFSVDPTDPVTTTLTVASSPNPSSPGQPVTFTASAAGGARVPTGSVTFTAGATTLGTAPLTDGVATLVLADLAPGSHVVTASYAGDGYHTGTTATTTHVVAVPVPVVSAVDPPSGSVLGGTRVTLRGTGLSGATQVSFGGVPGTGLQVLSSTKAEVTTPAGAAGAVPVVVTTPGGASAPVTFTYTELVTQAPARAVADWSVPAGQARCQQVAGTNGVPDEATGVIVNVTTVRPSGPGYVVVYPDTTGTGATQPPGGSTVNFEPGADVANSAFVALPDNGTICWYTRGASTAGVLVDVAGYTLPGSGIITQASQRLLDTRATSPVGQVTGPVRPHQVYTVDVAGQAGVPADAAAVLVNVTVAEVATIGNLRVFPGGQPVPGTSVINYAPGRDKANATIVALGPDGTISFWSDTAGTAQVILDVVGYVQAGSAYTGITPQRILDTRPGTRTGPITGPLAPRQVHSMPVRGTGPVPAGATAVVLNVTAIGPTANGNLRVYPDTDGTGTTPPPGASSINYIPGRDIPNQVVVALPANGQINFYNDALGTGTVHLAVDVAGYIAGPSTT